MDDLGEEIGLDHKGLYSRGRLINGLSIYLDAPGDEGMSLHQIREEIATEKEAQP